jgi:hypothetical protein
MRYSMRPIPPALPAACPKGWSATEPQGQSPTAWPARLPAFTHFAGITDKTRFGRPCWRMQGRERANSNCLTWWRIWAAV